jgi:hypothetical protein
MFIFSRPGKRESWLLDFAIITDPYLVSESEEIHLAELSRDAIPLGFDRPSSLCRLQLGFRKINVTVLVT